MRISSDTLMSFLGPPKARAREHSYFPQGTLVEFKDSQFGEWAVVMDDHIIYDDLSRVNWIALSVYMNDTVIDQAHYSVDTIKLYELKQNVL